MLICGLNKTTLLDYPGKVAATVFTGGCNFRCPFCHNKDLVLHPSEYASYTDEDVFAHLKKRAGILQGVCVTGGEPTLQKDLPDFLARCKDLGYAVKLDTNGTNPDMMKSLYKEGLIDYVAMDIKSGPTDYALVAGLITSDFDDPSNTEKSASATTDYTENAVPISDRKRTILSNIKESVRFLLEDTLIKDTLIKDTRKSSDPSLFRSDFDFEFRTTVVKQLHNTAAFEEIADWIAGAPHYFLQSYEDSDGVLSPGLSACSKEELEGFADIVRKRVPSVELRGVD